MSTQVILGRDERFNVDLEKLLSPISAEQPAGESLRHTGIYDGIKDARREDDPTLNQGVWQHDLKKADWDRVMLLSLESIETKSKDLQLAVWLLEAWAHVDGLVGLVQGLDLINGLCQQFWDHLHPQIEEGDTPEVRVAPLQWMSEKLPQTLKRIPVTRPSGENAATYCWADWEDARHLAALQKSDKEAAALEEAKGKITQEKFRASESLTPTTFYEQLARELGAARDRLSELDAYLDEKCGREAPSLSSLRESIDEIRNFVALILKHRIQEGESIDEELEAGVELLGDSDDAQSDEQIASGAIRSRSEAYRRLADVAEFLQRTEPHSPTSYLVRRAVSWGSMTLAELLQELLQDNADLNTLYKLLGIKEIQK